MAEQNQRNRGKTVVVLSSLPLQILLYLNGWYFGFFWICELLMYIYKGSILPYPSQNIIGEVILLFMLAIIEGVRLFFGTKGNLTEKVVHLAVSVALLLPVSFGTLFVLLWQTYVLRAEIILCSILLIFFFLEVIFEIVTLITFGRAANQVI
ncbi:transmembrane protein 216-like [Apostichopus japonicus]|uniref:transmembrane protein 216-like n=1 Tax=Stichopus japonicus TaxID=307972 RepID=UPI003AB6EE9A